MGATIANYFYSPEEKVGFAKFAETKRAPMSLADVETFAVPLAQSAGLAELEARWRYELMMESGQEAPVRLNRMNGFVNAPTAPPQICRIGTAIGTLCGHVGAPSTVFGMGCSRGGVSFRRRSAK